MRKALVILCDLCYCDLYVETLNIYFLFIDNDNISFYICVFFFYGKRIHGWVESIHFTYDKKQTNLRRMAIYNNNNTF